MKRNKGITLIALIITIIIMLILAAVSISMAVNGGLFNYAGKASKETEIAKSAELSWALGTIGDMTIDDLIEGNTVLSTAGTDKGIKFTIEGIKVKNPPIPEGFSYKEGTVDTGYVIVDTSDNENTRGNEFVWVPVAKNQKISLYIEGDEDITLITVKDPYNDVILSIQDGDVETTYSNNDITPTINGDYKVEVTRASGKITETLKVRSLYAKEKGRYLVGGNIKDYIDSISYANSVNKNGGFYMGRYEAGTLVEMTNYDSSLTSNDLIELNGIPVCKQNIKPYGYLNATQAKGLAESIYVGKKFTCTLPTGAAWDRTLDWFIETNAKTVNEVTGMSECMSWGNYQGSEVRSSDGTTIIKQKQTATILNTGITTYTMANNIYDLNGNQIEWSLETKNDVFCYRGGWLFIFALVGPPTACVADSGANSGDTLVGSISTGFRPVIYL